MTPRMLVLALLALVACKGSDSGDTGPSDPLWCGDVDEAGGETGDVPNIVGQYQGYVAPNFFKENCGLSGLDEGALFFLGQDLEIEGFAPDGLALIAQEDRTKQLRGIISPTGGVNFSGRRPTSWGVMNIAVGGLLYSDSYVDQDFLQGFVYVGLDETNDKVIDCDMWADWRAYKLK